jgi:hypothetical protein
MSDVVGGNPRAFNGGGELSGREGIELMDETNA